MTSTYLDAMERRGKELLATWQAKKKLRRRLFNEGNLKEWDDAWTEEHEALEALHDLEREQLRQAQR